MSDNRGSNIIINEIEHNNSGMYGDEAENITVLVSDDDRDLMKSIKKGGTIASIVMAVIGALAIFAPVATGLTAAYLITGGFTIYGIFRIIAYFETPKALRSGFMLADGILSALLGGMILVDAVAGPAGRASMIATLSFAAGFMALFGGVTQTADYFSIRKSGIPGTGVILFGGILRMLTGALIILNPFIGWFSIQMGLGVFLIISAIALFADTRAID